MDNARLKTPSGWYVLCKSNQLKKKPKRLMFDGQALVAFRDEAGHVGVLDDFCIHRGAPLSKGRVCGNHVQCPYHGWEYDRTGAVVVHPALPNCPEAWNKKSAQAYHAEEQEGFIWIRIGNGLDSSSPPSFTNFRCAGWTTFVMQTRFTGTVESCLENFLDCPHATFVHRYFFRTPTGKPVRAVVRTLDDGAEAEFFEEPREMSAVWWLLSPSSGSMSHTDRFIAPNTSRVDYLFPNGLHYIITSSCTPLNARETLVHTVITFRYGRIGFLVRAFFEPLSRWIIRQDVRMLALQQNNLEAVPAGARRQFQSTAADLLGTHIHQWRKAMSRDEPLPEAGLEYHVNIYL